MVLSVVHHSNREDLSLIASRVSDLKERVGVTEAMVCDHLGISDKAVSPVGANAALACALQEEGDEGCCMMDGIHCQQIKISEP